MAVVTYLLRADLRKRWRSLAMLALLVAIVVGAVLTATAGARRTRTAFDRYLEEVRPGDALVTFEGEPPDLAAVEQIDGVEAAVGFRWYAVFPTGGPDGFYFIPLLAPSDARVPDTYERAPLVDGRAPDPNAPLEIALGERTARRLGVGVGDQVPTVTYTPTQQGADSESAPEGPELTFDVVGILRTPGDVTARENDIDPNFLTPAFASTYGDDVGLFGTGMLLALEPGASVDQVAGDTAALGESSYEESFGPDVLRNQADPTLAAMATGLRVVAIIVALAGGIVLAQALARAATDRLRDHEGIRALGAERSVLLAHLSLPSALAAAVGVIVGGALSIALSPFVLWGLARRAEPDRGVRIDLPVLTIGTAAAAALLASAIALVAAMTLRRDRQTDDAGARTSAVASRAAGLGAPVPAVTGLRLALERGRGDRTTPVATAAVAAALGGIGVMATVVFASSLHHAVTTPSVYGWAVDGVLVGSENGDDLGDDAALASALTVDPSFESVAEIVNDLEVTVNGIPDRTWVLHDLSGHSSFVMVRGREPIGPDEVAVGGDTLDRLGLDVGDTVEVSAGGPARALEIVGVTALPVTEDGGSSSVGLAMDRDAADTLGFSGDCPADAECSRYLGLTTVPGTRVTDAVEPHLSDAVSLVTPTPPGQVERLRAVDGLPRALALVLGIIAVLAVTHAAAVTVRRRRAELAMLRVLGLYGRQLRRVVTVQVAVLALGGAVIGVVLGLALGRLLWTAVADSVPLPVVITFPATAVVVVPLAIAVLAQLATSLSRRSAGRVRPALALRAE